MHAEQIFGATEPGALGSATKCLKTHCFGQRMGMSINSAAHVLPYSAFSVLADTPPADTQGGPTGQSGDQFVEKTDIKDVADPEGIKWGEGPESPVDPKTAYQNR